MGTAKMTREEAIARFIKARQYKREIVAELEKDMKKKYEERTGKKANYFFAL